MKLSISTFVTAAYISQHLWTAAGAARCNLRTGNFSYTQSDILDCFNTVPLNSTVVNHTIATVSAAIENYGFLPFFQHSGRPWNYQYDLLAELDTLQRATLQNDWDFHARIGAIFSRLQDGHTTYFTPDCYAQFFAIQPITIQSVWTTNGDIQLHMNGMLLSGQDITSMLVPELTDAWLGAVIQSINGIDPLTFILDTVAAELAQSYSDSSMFNQAILQHGFVLRSLSTAPMPAAPSLTYQLLRPVDGATMSLTVPWRFSPGTKSVQNQTDFIDWCQQPPLTPVVCNATSSWSATDHKAGNYDVWPRLAPAAAQVLAQNSQAVAHERAIQSLLQRVADEFGTTPGTEIESVGMQDPRLRKLRGNDLSIDGIPTDPSTGVSMFHVQIPSEDVNSIIVRLSTFGPPGFEQCSGLIANACPTQKRIDAYNTCAQDAMNQFLGTASLQVAQEYQAREATALIIDAMSNPGGIVVLGQLLLMLLFEDIHRKPHSASSLYDMQASAMFTDIGQWSMRTKKAVPGFALADNLLDRTGQPTSYANGSMAAMDWYSPGETLRRGAGADPYTQPFVLWDTGAMAKKLSAPAVRFDHTNTLMLTDGLCGSTCAQFLQAAVDANATRVLGVGGVPWLGMDSTSFLGGFIAQGVGSMLSQARAAAAQGWTPSTAAAAAPPGIPTTADFGWNWGVARSRTRPDQPAQFVATPPDARLAAWPTSSASMVLLYGTVALMEKGITRQPLLVADLPPAVPGGAACKSSDSTSLTVGVVVLGMLVVLLAVGLVLLSMRLARGTWRWRRDSTSSGHVPIVPGDKAGAHSAEMQNMMRTEV